jgi:predicted dehydrogenase
MAQFDCALTLARHEAYVAAGTDGYFFAPAAFLPGKDDILLHEFRDRKEIQHRFTGCDEYQLMVEHFAGCVLKREQPRYSAVEAAANMRVIETLYQSARLDGTWQSVLPLT